MRPLGDRRAHLRMEVVGALWGTLELSETARVVNISTSGVLLDASIPLAKESIQPVSLRVDGDTLMVDAHVRRVEQVVSDNTPPRYYLGLEFDALPLPLVRFIEGLDRPTENN